MKSAAEWSLLLHLIAIIAWMGPALGAWSIYLRNKLWRKREPGPHDAVDDFILAELLRVLQLEHFAFILLVTTGIIRAHVVGLDDLTVAPLWFRIKLAIFAGVIVPFEAYDIWLAHWVLPERLARRKEDPEAFARAHRRHDLLVWVGSLILGGAIPAIFYLVIFRPT